MKYFRNVDNVSKMTIFLKWYIAWRFLNLGNKFIKGLYCKYSLGWTKKIPNYSPDRTCSVLKRDKYYQTEAYPGAMEMVKGFNSQTLPWKQIK